MKVKPKNKSASVSQKNTGKSADDPRLDGLRRLLPRLAALFLIIVFLVSECAPLLTGE